MHRLPGTFEEWSRSISAVTGCTAVGSATAIGTVTVAVLLQNLYQPTPSWKNVMWEGGVLEWLTVLNFVAAGGFYLHAAFKPRTQRAWFALLGVGCLFLAGEELNWGKGMLVLNLDDPDFAKKYNIQGGNLHNFFPALAPIVVFLVIACGLRVRAGWLSRFAPVPVGFLNCIVLAAISVAFMELRDDRFLHVDEVLEWSSSVFILGLALHCRYGWFFVDAMQGKSASPTGRVTENRVSRPSGS